MMKEIRKCLNKPGLNANALKVIAIIAMTIDHFTDIFYPGFPNSPVPLALHFIGRLTAPIMWFFVCEGYYYTKDVRKCYVSIVYRSSYSVYIGLWTSGT